MGEEGIKKVGILLKVNHGDAVRWLEREKNAQYVDVEVTYLEETKQFSFQEFFGKLGFTWKKEKFYMVRSIEEPYWNIIDGAKGLRMAKATSEDSAYWIVNALNEIGGSK